MRVGCDGEEEFEFGLLVEERWGGQSWAGAEGKVALADPCLVRGLNNRRRPYVNPRCPAIVHDANI